MPFEFEKQAIEDVILVKPKVFGDNRGFFMETYKKSDFFICIFAKGHYITESATDMGY